ncbi:hypothetical protein LMG28614_00135 [Paraburkholderia ultramafica]|uniref:Uncharacterized protein n=1 Tax=Paraburkholderia ultramafica TaxID=1544867 RepID=A0A6S7CB62_9BURK|nr:hypothetical protein LMG28614_00135 [Paraburkholderia ultramafica]
MGSTARAGKGRRLTMRRAPAAGWTVARFIPARARPAWRIRSARWANINWRLNWRSGRSLRSAMLINVASGSRRCRCATVSPGRRACSRSRRRRSVRLICHCRISGCGWALAADAPVKVRPCYRTKKSRRRSCGEQTHTPNVGDADVFPHATQTRCGCKSGVLCDDFRLLAKACRTYPSRYLNGTVVAKKLHWTIHQTEIISVALAMIRIDDHPAM